MAHPPLIQSRRPLALALGIVAALALAGAPAARMQPAGPGGTIVALDIASQALAENALGISAAQQVAVYLPPGYASGDRRYPVLYLLHGIGGSSGDWTAGPPGIAAVMDRALARGTVAPMLVVMPTAMTPYGGSFYVNSSLNGRWMDFLVEEVVAAVDRTYRTQAAPERRALAGHSMGGYGALVTAMRRPGVFGAVYAMAPCCLDVTHDLDGGNAAWRLALEATALPPLIAEIKRGNLHPLSFIALAAALSPRPSHPPLSVELPFALEGDDIRPVAAVLERWRSQMPVAMVESHAEALKALRELWIDYGYGEQFPHIPAGSEALAAALARHDVPFVLDTHGGDHRNRVWTRLEWRVLPQVSSVLQRP